MSQLSRVAKQLRKNTEYPGISINLLASRVGAPRESVAKRVYDLREEGRTIYTNKRDGKVFYRLTA